MDFNDATIVNIVANIVSILAGFVVIITGAVSFVYFVKKAKEKKISSNRILTDPGEHAIYLNKNRPTQEDKCMGRDQILKDILNTIKTKNPVSFIGNHIYITGSEGIGKTLFCKVLFLNYLRDSKVYLGWIECNGCESIFNIVKKEFIEPFKGKNKQNILAILEKLDRPCVLFVDQVDQYMSFDEIKELIICPNTTVVVSGLLKNMNLIIDKENHFHLDPLNDKIVKKIFELKAHEKIEYMIATDRQDVNFLISEYVKGNPFLAGAFARAKAQNNNTWKEILNVMRGKEYYGEKNDDNYVKNILRQLYKINKLMDDEKNTLSKLCVFSSLRNTKEVFVWSNIPMDCVTRLCQTYWFTQEDSVMYCMDEIHKDVLKKVLVYSDNLRELIISLASYIGSWDTYEDKGFKHISSYVEDILKKVKGYAPHLMEDSDLFARFAYLVANNYHFAIKDNEKSLEWLGYCNPTGVIISEEIVFSVYNKLQESNKSVVISNDIFDLPSYLTETLPKYSECKQLLLESIKKEDISKLQLKLIYDKAVLEFLVKMEMLNSPFEPVDIEQVYSNALSIAERFDDYDKRKKYLKEEYCIFLYSMGRYDEVKSLCKEHFDTYGFSFNDDYSCSIYYRYLCAAKSSNDEEVLNGLVSDDILISLWQNNELSITVAWSFGELYHIYKKWGNDQMAELCKRRMVILINRKRCFWHPEIKEYIKTSDEEFMEYMHSNDELQESLEEAIKREDAEALYLEGRYQERKRNFNKAFSMYERSATKDNLKGICSLALMYYRGSEYYKGLEESQNFNKAREYWEYCNTGERTHRGSHYWLGIMLLDKKYKGYDRKLAMQHLTKAAEMGSKHAKQKLQELRR